MAENSLKITCSEQVLKRLEAKSAKVPETKVLEKCQRYNFSSCRFSISVEEFGEKCTASFRFGEVQSETNVYSQLQRSFQLC